MKRLIISFVILALAISACSVFGAPAKAAKTKTKAPVTAAAPAKAAAPAVVAPQKGESHDAFMERVLAMPDNTIIARVDGVPITKGQLIKQLWMGQATTELESLCEKNALYGEIKKAGITVSDAEVEEEINKAFAANQITDVDAYLASKGISKSRLMSDMRMNLLVKKYADVKFAATKDDVKDYIKASHILIKFDPADPEEEQDAKCLAKIQEVNAKLKAGEDFAELAKEYSEDNTASKGGSLGWFDQSVNYVPEFKTAVFALEEGQVSEPVKTDFGYHLIKVDKLGKNADKADLEEINTSSSFSSKRSQEMNKWYNDIMDKKQIENYLAAPSAKE
ncbi:MAG: peptidylprolyl isomerase [Abditibacteriota bacterium]|nr:peptidylprolyl isomerase [Abditibacteriota bacterium]